MEAFLNELPLSQFISFIMYAPPGTAIYHVVNEGWTPDTHRLTDLVDIGSLLLWAKTEDGQENRNRPDQLPRPGSGPKADVPPAMTIGDYMRLSGLED